MTKQKHEIGEDLDVWYEDEDWVAAYGHFDSLDAASWEIIERLWKFFARNDVDAFDDPKPEARAILIKHMATSVTLRHMWGKKCPNNKYEFDEYGGSWHLLERSKKPLDTRGWFQFTRCELVTS